MLPIMHWLQFFLKWNRTEKSIRLHSSLGLLRTPNSITTLMTRNLWQFSRHSRLGDITLKAPMFRLMSLPTTKTWNIFVQHGFYPGDKLGGLLSCLVSTWLLDSVLAASERNPMHSLVGQTSTQKGRESCQGTLIFAFFRRFSVRSVRRFSVRSVRFVFRRFSVRLRHPHLHHSSATLVLPSLCSVRFPLSFLFFPQLHYFFRFILYFHLFCLLIVALMFISICHRVSPVSQLYFIYRQCCTLAGLLLGSPARCTNYCSLLCQIYLF